MSSAAQTIARAALDPLLSLVFPSSCVVCRDLLHEPSRGPLCPECFVQLPRHRVATCACGLPLPLEVAPPCGRCRRGLEPWSSGASLGPYEGSLKVVLQALKYRRRRSLAARVADALLAEESVRRVLTAETLLLPVPLHPRRLRERGFNQSELIARALGRRTGLPVLSRALYRTRETRAQAGLSAAERRRNVAGAFGVRQPWAVERRTLVVVDDVFTTGATLRACAGPLRSAGAANVRALTVARVA